MTRSIKTAGPLLTLFLAMLGLWGCASTVELPPEATRDLANLRDRAVAAKAQIQTTCNAARDLNQQPTQVDPLAGRLVQEIHELSNLAAQGRQDVQGIDARTTAYLTKWDEDLKSMSESISEPGQKRRSEAIASYEHLKSLISDFRMEFQPFMADLDEVARYLSTDGTAAGVQVVKPKISTSLGREGKLMKRLDAVIAQISSMRGGK
ncbi:MAG: hypothetical protein K8S99_14220 [Planctomycetes bacterium]|nr:hypothetical protein [Planctomycetota bacterium]